MAFQNAKRLRKKKEKWGEPAEKITERLSKRKPPEILWGTRAQCGKELLKEIPPSGTDLLCLDGHKKK